MKTGKFGDSPRVSEFRSGEIRKHAGCPRIKGGALLSVLWLSAALAAIAFSVSIRVRSETDRVLTAADGLRAWYLASGSVERGIQWMMWGGDYRREDGSARFWEPNTPRLLLSYPSGDAVVEMIPESSKLNINTASANDLERVAQAVSGDPARAQNIAAGILDWRSSTGPQQNSLALAPTIRPRHTSFEEIEELLSVRGMTPELFYGNYVSDAEGRLYPTGGLRDCLSVWGSSGPFDINTASPALLEALGMARREVSTLIAQRVERPFRNLAEVSQLGVQRIGLGGNLIWTMRAAARLRRPDGTPSEVVRSAAAVVKLLPRDRYFQAPVHVLRYYDDAWSEFAVVPPAVTPIGVPGR